jgi:hypothetical protein
LLRLWLKKHRKHLFLDFFARRHSGSE